MGVGRNRKRKERGPLKCVGDRDTPPSRGYARLTVSFPPRSKKVGSGRNGKMHTVLRDYSGVSLREPRLPAE